MPFVEGPHENSWRRTTKIQNDHSSIVLHWNIKIDYQDNWWKITSGSQLSGSLEPGEATRITIEVDRSGKENGEYWGKFFVESHGTSYSYNAQVSVIMEVGDLEQQGPQLININTNTGNTLDRIVLGFDKYIDKTSANKSFEYIISPPIDITYVWVDNDKVTLATAVHDLETNYQITIPVIKDQRNRASTNLKGGYQFYYCCAGLDLDVSGSSGKYEWDNAVSYKRIYSDRNYALGQVPAEYMGCAMLRTDSEDVMQENLEISFTINCENAKIILAYDPRKSAQWDCSWLESDFIKLDTTMPVDTSFTCIDFFDLYESIETYQSGQVVKLYQNGALNDDAFMYFVMIKENIPSTGISGSVNYYTGAAVGNTTIHLTGGETDSVTTDNTGYYNFIKLEPGLDYTVTPSKTGDISKTTIMMYDASLTAQIAVKLIPHPTEAQLIAADVDKNGIVTMDDAVMIAKYVVGLSTASESNVGQWLFQPRYRSYSSLDSTKQHQNFSAIVLGDVDGNWAPAASLSGELIKKMDKE